MQYLCKEAIVLSPRNSISDAKDLYMEDEPSIDGKQTVYRWETDHLFSLHRPSVFLLLELYVFMYHAIN